MVYRKLARLQLYYCKDAQDCNYTRMKKGKKMSDLCSGQLKLYSSISETNVDWLWYPYIPFGKLTVLSGDPGNGKSTLMMNLIAAVSSGGFVPDGRKLKKPIHVIYQCSEDSAGDTIKPRLIAAGADCSNVAFLDEELAPLSLDDEVIRRAIADFNAKLLVIDPVQAYLGDADISNVGGMRKVLHQLAIWAGRYDCAIVLVGHLNKRQSGKDIYRSLGSIDLIAAARSAMQIDRTEDDPDVLVLRHIKSSLAYRGSNAYFEIDENNRIQWIEKGEADSDIPFDSSLKLNKQEHVASILMTMLESGPVKASDIHSLFQQKSISERTANIAKKTLGIHSVKRDGIWYWELPNDKSLI